MNTSAVELLKDYEFWATAFRKKQNEIKRLEERKTSITAENDGLPKGTVRYTMEDYMAEKEQLQEEARELRSRMNEIYDRIFGLLVRMRKPREVDVLYRRYINLDSWDGIERQLGYSRSHLMYLHKKALENLESVYVQYVQTGI